MAVNVLYIDRVEDNAFFQYDLYGHALAQKLLPWGSKNLRFFCILLTEEIELHCG